MMNRSALKWITLGVAGAMAIAVSIPVADYLISSDGVTYANYDASHPEYVGAALAARNSLGHFREQLEASTTSEGFIVEVKVFTVTGNIEVVALGDVSFVGEEMVSGEILDRPLNKLRGGLKQGDTVTAPTRDVTDWSYWDGDKMRGHFTTRVLLKLQDEETQAAMRATIHDNPLP